MGTMSRAKSCYYTHPDIAHEARLASTLCLPMAFRLSLVVYALVMFKLGGRQAMASTAVPVWLLSSASRKVGRNERDGIDAGQIMTKALNTNLY
jgi:hypothetical protein